jgi:hypothetical protein
MERLTERRGARSWFLYHVGWYLNLALVLMALLLGVHYLTKIYTGSTTEPVSDTVIMMSFFVMASILLMGAGISRYQARLEGQHLEIKLAIASLHQELAELRGSQAEKTPAQ